MALDFSNIKPIKLDDKQTDALNSKLQNQVNRVVTPVASDERVKMWQIPVNDKALIYIPNFTRTNDDGSVVLNTERAFVYSTRGQGSYAQIRDTTGLTGLSEVGISGNDPLRTVEQENWSLYNFKVDKEAKAKNVDRKSDALQSVRSNLLNEFTVRPANEYYYFPIVEIETEVVNGVHDPRKIVKNDDGTPKTHVYLYRISRAWYEKFFDNIASTLAEGDTIGGHFYQFSYTTGKKTEELANPRRDSGLAFNPTKMDINMSDEAKEYLDDQARFLTPEYMRETVYQLMLLPDSVHETVAKEAHDLIEDELNLVKAAQAMGSEDAPALESGDNKTAVEGLMNNLTSNDSAEPAEGEAGTPDFGSAPEA